ncbi:mechanosensitive ion channel family protein [Caldibacillus debilis]|jgi:MscS family membrane protein|uniref:Small-conductance mechanosensitive channel n=1 Tax=Caldibacillus debilis GB1 TaxID=1339248 RepID=A0A420VKB8_9BACI|nr:mechanosensitive ion channel family protein [Caldibacillus debilis]RKO63990.1 Small-conductance mechanosensitive channel [Caldibacillus debilis GB1]
MWNSLLAEETIQIRDGLLVFALFLFLYWIFKKWIFQGVLALLQKTPSSFLPYLWESFKRPIQVGLIAAGLIWAVHIFPFVHIGQLFLEKVARSVFIVLLTWGFYNFSSTSSSIFENLKKRMNVDIDQIFIPFLSKTIRLVIVAISITIIAQEFNYNISGFIAGLGLGGLAVALAAKEVLANLLGGIVIIFERPFSIGDSITTPSVEGTVEDITFRSTKIRNPSQALVTVPNSILANQPITNNSRIGKRKISFNLEILWAPRNKLERAVKRLEEMLHRHPGIQPEDVFVKLDQIRDGKMVLIFNFFTKSSEWSDFLDIKQEINLNILQILEEEGLQVSNAPQPMAPGSSAPQPGSKKNEPGS